MSESMSDGQEGVEEDTDADGNDDTSEERTRINVTLGNLTIEVENHDREMCEEQFYRIYEYVIADVDEWSRAMDSVLTQKGGFQ